MKVMRLVFGLLIACCVIYLFVVAISKKTMPTRVNTATLSKAYMIEDIVYFDIASERINKYTLKNGETLFSGSGLQGQRMHSIEDKYGLPATVVEWLNRDLFQATRRRSSGERLSVNVLEGPFYLQIDSSDTLELKIGDYACCRIKFKIKEGDPPTSIYEEKGVEQALLIKNVLERTVISRINDTCIFPLDFKESSSEMPLITIVPEEVVCESLFASQKKSECILEVSNSNYALLVSVLKANKSVFVLGDKNTSE